MTLVDRRIGLLFACFLAFLGLALVRALWLGTVRGDTLSRAAATQQVAEEVVPAARGSILDRHGFELAVSEPASDVSATPYLIKEPARTADRLAPLLGVAPADLLHQLTRRDTGFAYLKREVPADRAEKVRRLHIEGITLAPAEHREYPRRWLAAQLLGSVGTDDKGLSGVELARNRALTGGSGTRSVTRDALGQVLAIQDGTPAQRGGDVRLTIDAQIQGQVEEVLHGLGAKYHPKGASAIVMDPQTGEVLAMGNWPQVDANDPGGAPLTALRNLATNFTYEPGSTFKAFTVAGALQDGLIEPDTPFDLAPQITVADKTIGESHARGPETLTTQQILAQSSNVGAITIGLKLGAKRFDGWVRRFGFGKPTGVDLPGEERGLVLKPSHYSGSSMGNLPIGQGESVTQMQIATAYAALANGGVLRAPRIVESIGGKPVAVPKPRRVVTPKVSAQVRDMLKGVFAPGGTASEVSIPGYELAGKTGTANKIDPTTGEYSKAHYTASFVGMAPAKSPKLLVSVMVDEPQGSIFGGQVAAPAFGKIAQFALQYLRIPPG